MRFASIFSGFGIFGFFFFIIFSVIICMFLVALVRGVSTWSSNNRSPRLTVPAVVVSKRANVSHSQHHHNKASSMPHTSTSYYTTFQVESGDRMEFLLTGSEYGMLAEGDHGKLTFQGTRYLGFERNPFIS